MEVQLWVCGENFGISIDDGATLFNHAGRRMAAGGAWEYEDDCDIDAAADFVTSECHAATMTRIDAIEDAQEAAEENESSRHADLAEAIATGDGKFEVRGIEFRRVNGQLSKTVRKKGGRRYLWDVPVTEREALGIVLGKCKLKYRKGTPRYLDYSFSWEA